MARSFTCFNLQRRTWPLLAVLLALATATPLQAAVILQYHHISDTTPASTSTSPARFALHLELLAEQGFEVVPLATLADAQRRGEPLPDKVAAITFDDGYISIYDTALPLLRERGWPFTVFINTNPHDQRNRLFMSWDQLRELAANGGTIANHTAGHPYLLQRVAGEGDARWQARIRGEITRAQQRIEEEMGSAPMLFAHPYGEYDAKVLALVGELGFAGFGQQSGPPGPYSDLRALPRFPFGGQYGDREDFLTKLNSLPMPLAAGPDSLRLESETGEPLADAVLEGPARPVLALRFAGTAPGLSCFVSGQGRGEVTVAGEWVRVQATQPLPPGRSRYNCTAPAGDGRFYWLSQTWIRD